MKDLSNKEIIESVDDIKETIIVKHAKTKTFIKTHWISMLIIAALLLFGYFKYDSYLKQFLSDKIEMHDDNIKKSEERLKELERSIEDKEIYESTLAEIIRARQVEIDGLLVDKRRLKNDIKKLKDEIYQKDINDSYDFVRKHLDSLRTAEGE